MPLAKYDPKLFDTANKAMNDAVAKGQGHRATMTHTLPGWAKPLTFRLSRDTHYVYLDSDCGVHLAVCG